MMKQELITKKKELPEGWKIALLLDVVDVEKGTEPGSSSYSNTNGTPFLRIGEVSGKSKSVIFTTSEKIKLVNENDILMTFDGSPGLVCKGLKGAISSGIRKISSKDEGVLLNDYLFRILQTRIVQKIVEKYTKGAILKHAGSSINHIKIILPPLPIQQKIVSKLDMQMAQIEMMKKEAEKELYSIKELIPSSLQKLFHNKVPVKSNKSQKTSNPPNEWKWVKLIDIAKLESGHTPRKTIDSYWVGGDVPWISLQDIKNFEGDYINDTIDHPTMEGIKNSSARILPKDTVVLSRDASIGHVIIMKRDMATTQHFVNYICSDKIKSPFLLYLLRASKIEFDRLKEGAIIKTLYMPLIKSFEIMLPPLNVQDEIIVRMKKIYEYQKILQTESENKLNAISQLPASILNEVFGQYKIPEEV